MLCPDQYAAHRAREVCQNTEMAELTVADLLGSWTLSEWRIDYSDGRVASWPFGKDAIGLLIYAADGWMSATMSRRSRARLSAISALQADEASRARAFQEYLSYSGRWSLQGSRIAHDVEMSLNPALLGTRQWRDASLEQGALVLGATEPLGDGTVRQHRIVWQRRN